MYKSLSHLKFMLKKSTVLGFVKLKRKFIDISAFEIYSSSILKQI